MTSKTAITAAARREGMGNRKKDGLDLRSKGGSLRNGGLETAALGRICR